MKVQFSLISEESYVKDFDCGNLDLNTFLKKFALFNQTNRLATTTIICDGEDINNKAIGFYTLCPSHIQLESLPKQYHNKPFPDPIHAFRLARLAVDKTVQGLGYGKILLAHALKKCYRLSEEMGGYIVLIDVKEEAKKFYEHFGFSQVIKTSPLIIGVRIKDIKKYL